MRRFILLLALAILLGMSDAAAQLNKAYFFYVGRNFLIENKYQDAIETLNVLLKVDADAHEAYFLRGIAKYNLNDLLGAEQDFTKAIEKNPVFTTAFQYRAITRSMLGNYDDALKDFREAIDLRPDLPGPYYSRGVTYLLSQQFERAVEDFTKFIRQENKVADAYINRGTSYLYLKDTVRAYEDYETAIRTNREYPNGYLRRGVLYMAQKRYPEALKDLNQAIYWDNRNIPALFNRALVYSNTHDPLLSIADFTNVLNIDSTNSLTYFNRAILRTQIGDYNNALEDYNQVVRYSPSNVLVYYNRAALQSQLGNYPAAVRDYSQAIELYPDFANAYLGRSSLRYMLNDLSGAQSDKRIADQKIAEYRSKLNDSTFSIYADTSQRFNQLLSFEAKLDNSNFAKTPDRMAEITLLPMFKFSVMHPDSLSAVKINPNRYHVEQVQQLLRETGEPLLMLTNHPSNLTTDELFALDRRLEDSIRLGVETWQVLFRRGLSQSLVRQYTSSIAAYTSAIDRAPANPFLYLNRSTTQSEMVDFISSIDNSFQNITLESDPVNRLKNTTKRIYNYDEAIADLNKAAKLLPDFAHIYYNRANLLALSGDMPAAFDDYSKAIALYPGFAEAYYNRGLVQIYMKDTRKGCLDLSKAGELGIQQAYELLKTFTTTK